MASHDNRYTSGAASSSARAGRDKRLSSKPHSANISTLTKPVRDADKTTANTPSASSTPAVLRPSRRNSNKATTATQCHNSRLLRWLGWRRLPTARPG